MFKKWTQGYARLRGTHGNDRGPFLGDPATKEIIARIAMVAGLLGPGLFFKPLAIQMLRRPKLAQWLLVYITFLTLYHSYFSGR